MASFWPAPLRVPLSLSVRPFTFLGSDEQTIYCRTLDEALARCFVWLMAPEIGIGPFLLRPTT